MKKTFEAKKPNVTTTTVVVSIWAALSNAKEARTTGERDAAKAKNALVTVTKFVEGN